MAKLVGFRFLTLTSVLTAGIAVAPGLPAQVPELRHAPVGPAAAPAEIDCASVLLCLGRDRFHDGRLSSNRKVSCATCHDPARSLADGVPQSKGVLGVDVGRNSPALWAVRHVARLVAFLQTLSPKTD